MIRYSASTISINACPDLRRRLRIRVRETRARGCVNSVVSLHLCLSSSLSESMKCMGSRSDHRFWTTVRGLWNWDLSTGCEEGGRQKLVTASPTTSYVPSIWPVSTTSHRSYSGHGDGPIHYDRGFPRRWTQSAPRGRVRRRRFRGHHLEFHVDRSVIS